MKGYNMELTVLDTNLNRIAILDSCESIIWTDRYYGYGDFEIYTSVSSDILNVLKEDYYLLLPESEHLMIIESFKIKSDFENGVRLIVTGRSIESILDRRIVWSQTVISGNLQNGIQILINDNIISPIISDRVIPNFIFEVSTDPLISSLTLEAQFIRTDLYETILNICSPLNISFKITLNDNNQFVFNGKVI